MKVFIYSNYYDKGGTFLVQDSKQIEAIQDMKKGEIMILKGYKIFKSGRVAKYPKCKRLDYNNFCIID